MSQSEIGVVGLAVMGANLARNFASRNIHTSVFNRTYEKTESLLKDHGNEYLHGFQELKDFIGSLEKPRRVLIMVKAGQPVDDLITQLTPLLETDDIIMDGGNSDYRDTIRRTKELEPKSLHFVGMGVSGGEEGALKGPSIMPGGSDHSWNALKPLLEKIAARDFDGNACVTHVGTDGAGHFVKMVHNGIEYAVMQIMAEAYDFLRKCYKLEAPQIADIFEQLHHGKLKSFLFEIAVPVLRQKDEGALLSNNQIHKPEQVSTDFLIDQILDKAGQKGTGAWTVVDAALRGVPMSSVSEAVFARCVSAQKDLRKKLGKIYKTKAKSTKTLPENFVPELENALYLAMTLCYAQGLQLITKAAECPARGRSEGDLGLEGPKSTAKKEQQQWSIDLSEICRIWQGGCIIRSELLVTLTSIYKEEPGIEHLLLANQTATIVSETLPDLKKLALSLLKKNIPAPCIFSTLNYFNAITSKELPANFIQALRDYFGAHTFERKDKKGIFHFNWY